MTLLDADNYTVLETITVSELTYSFFKCKQTSHNGIHITGEKTDFVGILGEISTPNPAIILVCTYMISLLFVTEKLRVEKNSKMGMRGNMALNF